MSRKAKTTVKTLFLSVAKKIAYLLAVLVIVFAFVITTTRLFTPLLDNHRADLEKWASELLATPVTIKNVEISWYQYQPEINLRAVTVLNKGTKEPVIEIQKVSIFMSIPKSVWQWKFVPSGVMIDGTNVHMSQNAQGELSVQGFPLGAYHNQPFKNETKLTDVLGWLSAQPRLILNNINVRYTNALGTEQLGTLYHLNIENEGMKHLILGKAVLHQTVPTEVTLALRATGDVAELTKIKAKIYLYVSGFSLSQWLKGRTWNGWELNQGLVSAKIWASLNNGTFKKIQTTFQAYGLQLFSQTDKTIHPINRLSGNVGWKKEEKDQVFAGSDILIDLPSHLWPATSFYLSLAPDANGKLVPKTANLGFVDLADIQDFIFSSPTFLSKTILQNLSELHITGGLQNAVIAFKEPWNDFRKISLNANVSRLGVLPWHNLPGVKNLSGTIKWNGAEGDLSLRSTRTLIQYDAYFANPILIDQLTGNIQWALDDKQNLVVRFPSLQLFNADAAANVKGTFTIPADGAPISDLSANFTMQNVSHITRYLPLRTFAPDLVKWLNQAFLGGEIPAAQAILRGPLNNFPFDKNNGTFLITGQLKNVDFRYAPNWPIVQQANGKLTFSGNKMLAEINQAVINHIPVANVKGEIPDFAAKKTMLFVNADPIQTDFTQALKFVRASPLQSTFGKMFDSVEMQGPVNLKLMLTVPLNEVAKTQVKGDMTIKEAQMDLTRFRLEMKQLVGELQFTENSLAAKGLQAKIFNRPIKFDLTTIKKTNDLSVVKANFIHQLAVVDLEKWLQLSFANVAQGTTEVSGEIDFSESMPIQASLRSNLVGITLNLPDQYAKTHDESRNFAADMILEEQKPLKMKILYDRFFSSALVMNQQANQFNLVSANIKLGSGNPDWAKTTGLYITGDLDVLDWDKVKTYTNQSNNNMNVAGLELRKIDIRTKLLKIFGQELNRVQLVITPDQSNWDIDISGPDMVGHLEVPTKITTVGIISAQFQRINIHTQPNTFNSELDIKSLPTISFAANDVKYNNKPLGQIAFKTTPSANGLNIQTFRIASPRINFRATGEWNQTKGTHLKGKASSNNVSNLLTSLGFDVNNYVSSNGSIDFDLHWQGAPFALTVANLNGRASLSLGKGRIVDIGQAETAKMDLGRMLNLFSLQTIPRRLSFDFSDIFHKGYSFDAVSSDLNFENGNAYTSNLSFQGPVASFNINGRIGLKNKDYDFIISVTPHITSGLPVAAAVISAWNPVISLAAMAVDTVISKSMSKVTTFYYKVTGSWDNPSWQPINAPR